MMTCLALDGVVLSDKRNKSILKKLITAADNGASENELSEVLANLKTSKTKLPFDIARIMQHLKNKTEDTVATLEKLAAEAQMLNTVGSVMADYLKDVMEGKEMIEDEHTLLSWKNRPKLMIASKPKKTKPTKGNK